MKVRSYGLRFRTPSSKLLSMMAVAWLLASPSGAQAQIRSISDGCLAENSETSQLTCTSNDVRISRAFASNVIDGCAFDDADPNHATFTLGVEVLGGAQQRFDIGAFIAEDGVDARNGECRVISFNHVNDPVDPGTFENFDSDTCGDITQGVPHTIDDVGTFTVDCRDGNDPDSFLEIDSCLSWDQNKGGVCNGPADVGAGAPSKCRCESLNIAEITVPPAECATNSDCNPDNDVCDGTEKCVAGECVPDQPALTCNPDTNACTDESCDPVQGCVSVNNDENVCDDGNFCTIADACVAGACTGSPRDCRDDNVCTHDSCDEALNACVNQGTAEEEGDPCTDDNFCTSDTMVPGTGDACRSGTCRGAPVNCNDNDACNGTEACDPTDGSCDSTGGIACDDSNPCTNDSCTPSTGACVNVGTPEEEGDPCTDDNFCTSDTMVPGTGDACRSGTCRGAPVNCDDSNACNGTEACDASDGSCDSSGAPDCDDDNSCTQDGCTPSTGACTNDPAPLEGQPCDDGLICTSDSGDPGPDACRSGQCHGGEVDCDDEDVCTDDSCNETDGCVNEPGAGSEEGIAEGDARAYGLSLVLLGTEVIEPTPDSNDTNPYEALGLPVDPLARVSLLRGSESENVTATGAETSAEAETGRVLLLDQTQGIGPIRLWTVTAKAVRTSSSSQADANGASSTGECELANVKIIGMPTLAHVTEPVSIPVVVPGVGAVKVNLCEKIRTGAAAGEPQPAADGTTSSGLTVNAIHVSAVAANTTLLDLVVAHSESDAAFATVCEQLADVSGEACVAELKLDEEILDPDNQLLGTDVGCVKLPSTGGDEDATLAHVGPLSSDAGLLLESNTAFSHTDGTPSGGSNSHAQVEDLDLLKLGLDPALITADAVRSECTARPDGTVTADTVIAGLTIGGQDVCTALGLAPAPCALGNICCEPPANTDVCAELGLTALCDPLGVSIILNEQIDTSTGEKAEIEVNAVHVSALGGDIPASLDLKVSRSHCDVKKAAAPE